MRFVLVACLLAGCASSSNPDPAPIVVTDASTPLDTQVVDAQVVDAPVDVPVAVDAACTLKKPYSSKNAVCNACAQTKCCAQVNACLGDLRCDDDYVNCILACALLPDEAGTEGACIAECGTKHPEGKKLYEAAIGCVDAACKSECG